MGLNTNERQDVTFFTGYEVEHTVCYGMFTLFVVGTPSTESILKTADFNQVKQIYFGTSQSYHPTEETKSEWDRVIRASLDEGYWVALDYGVEYHNQVLEAGYNEYEKFIGMISVKLPHIRKLNYNTTIKLDDTTWGDTNPGVWTHHLQSLMSKDKFTYWDQYTEDTQQDVDV